MHWPRNLGEWGFWIGILAILLAYPLALLANVTSPRIENWWAARSAKALRERISHLERRLAFIKRQELLSEYEEIVLRSLARLITAIAQIAGAFFAVGLVVTIEAFPKYILLAVAAAITGVLANSAFITYVSFPISKFLSVRTTKGREKVEADIKMLKAKLSH